ncbi:MAG: hypothetical protein KHZ62_00330 [Clostridiales bacterium]|nr:hypothetical protein [Clostridiales bacterium]
MVTPPREMLDGRWFHAETGVVVRTDEVHSGAGRAKTVVRHAGAALQAQTVMAVEEAGKA